LYKAPLYFNNDKYYLLSEIFGYEKVTHHFGEIPTYDELGSSKEHIPAKLYNQLSPGAVF